MKTSVKNLASKLSGHYSGEGDHEISFPCTLEDGRSGGLSFFSNPKYEHLVYTTKATAVLVPIDFKPKAVVHTNLIFVQDVNLALAHLMQLYSEKTQKQQSIHASALIDTTATIGNNVGIGKFSIADENVSIGDHTEIADHVSIGKNVSIGKYCIIYSGVKIYEDCKIGDHVIIHSNAVIGSDGFGFKADEKGKYHKVPQLGNVVIEDDVEIGSCTIIDRATLGSTIIKKGAKLDNLIQIAHNVVIGENTVIAAQTGIAGSTTVGSSCMLGGQVGLAGHIHIADGTMIQAKSGLSSDVKEKNKRWYGYPAFDYTSYLRSYALFKKLPDIVEKIRALEEKIANFGQPKSK